MHGAAVGEIVATRTRQHPNAQRQVSRHLVGSASKNVALVNESRNSAGRWALVDGDHPGESRVHRKPQHLAAQGRNRLVVRIERVEIESTPIWSTPTGYDYGGWSPGGTQSGGGTR